MTYLKIVSHLTLIAAISIIFSCGDSVTPSAYIPGAYINTLPATPFDGIVAKSNPDEMSYTAWIDQNDLGSYEDFVGTMIFLKTDWNPGERKIAPNMSTLSASGSLIHCGLVFTKDTFKVIANGTKDYEEGIDFSFEDKSKDASLDGVAVTSADFNYFNFFGSPQTFSYALSDSEVSNVYNASSAGLSAIAQYSFENNSNGITVDSINGNSAKINGGTKTITGVVNHSLLFRTSGDYLISPAKDNQNFSSGFSIAMWVYPDYSVSSTLELIDKGYNNADNYELYISNKALRFGFFDSKSNSKKYIDSGLDLTEHVWTYISVSVSTTGITFYSNGARVYGKTTNIYPVVNTTDLYIGRKNSSSDPRNFYGGLDEVSFYSKALSANEVTGLYNAFFIK